MKWLVTGGCGFIGRNLINFLLDDGSHAIRVIDNLSVGSRADLAGVCTYTELRSQGLGPMSERGEVEFVQGDILDADLVYRVSNGADVIVHLAANTGVAPSVEDPRADCVTNVIGTLNVLEAARHAGVKRFVFASSGAPVGECTPPIHEELAPHPVSPYGASKLAGEGYCSAYFRTFGLETVALRFGNVYGPRSDNKSSVIAKFVKQAIAGDVLRIYGTGTQTRDFIYVTDLVSAIYSASLTKNIGGETFQIATSAETTVSEIAGIVSDILVEEGFPHPQVTHEAPRVGDVFRNFSDTSKARRVLAWQAKTSLREGIRTTVRWFVQNNTAGNHFGVPLSVQ